jgi:hypothetical protein
MLHPFKKSKHESAILLSMTIEVISQLKPETLVTTKVIDDLCIESTRQLLLHCSVCQLLIAPTLQLYLWQGNTAHPLKMR